jgi:hypothetical protein
MNADQENAAKQLLLVLTLVFTSFFNILITGNKYLTDVLFVYTQGPIVYTLRYYMGRKELEDELVGLVITYVLAVLFYFVLTGTVNFLLLLFGLAAYLGIRSIVAEINVSTASPIKLLAYSIVIGLFSALIIDLFTYYLFI